MEYMGYFLTNEAISLELTFSRNSPNKIQFGFQEKADTTVFDSSPKPHFPEQSKTTLSRMQNRFGFTVVVFLTISILIQISNGAEQPKIPVKIAKMGGKLKSEFIQPEPEGISEEVLTSDEGEGSEVEYSDEEEEGDLGDDGCKKGFYWHIRGNRCVPLNCPTKKRDPVTGKCRSLYRYYGGIYRPGRYYSR
jgi:hypothetical protein